MGTNDEEDRAGPWPARFLRHYLLALQFFTRLPVTGRLAAWVGYSPRMLRDSAAHFPGVGWLLGAWMAAALAGLLHALPSQPAAPWVAAIAVTALGLLLTGAFHEDGLADLSDGLGGSLQRERALEIMKDSRIGSFGAAALTLALLAKAALLALLAQVDAALAVAAIWGAQGVSRTLPLLVVRALPHVGDLAGSKSKPLADAIGGAALAVAGLWCVLGLAGLALWQPTAPWAAALLGAAVGAALVAHRLWRRLQGFTGDGLGATQQLAELGFYLGMALGVGRG